MNKLQKLKKYLIRTLIAIAIIIAIFHNFTVIVNERGFLGMDKDGRQVFIQTINHYTSKEDGIMIASEWDDFSFLERLWQEPMRTTLRVYQTVSDEEYHNLGVSELFGQSSVEIMIDEISYKEFLQNYSSEIYMSEDYAISSKDLEKFANEAGVVTYRDLLSGFGFTNYEYYINGELKSAITLNPNITNHVEKKWFVTVGSEKNEPLKN